MIWNSLVECGLERIHGLSMLKRRVLGKRQQWKSSTFSGHAAVADPMREVNDREIHMRYGFPCLFLGYMFGLKPEPSCEAGPISPGFDEKELLHDAYLSLG